MSDEPITERVLLRWWQVAAGSASLLIASVSINWALAPWQFDKPAVKAEMRDAKHWRDCMESKWNAMGLHLLLKDSESEAVLRRALMLNCKESK